MFIYRTLKVAHKVRHDFTGNVSDLIAVVELASVINQTCGWNKKE